MGIPCFVIIAPGENDRRFSLQKKSGELVIGRHKKPDFNYSISPYPESMLSSMLTHWSFEIGLQKKTLCL